MLKLKILGYGLVALSLAGCITVGPDYQQPDAHSQTSAFQADVTEPDRFDWVNTELDWWRQFNDPDLNQLVANTLMNNFSLAEAASRVKAANARLGDQRDDLYPKGFASIGYDSGKAPVSPRFKRRIKSDDFNAGTTATQTFDFFGRVQRAIEAAQAGAESEAASLRAIQVEIVAEVVRNYGKLRTSQQRFRVAQENLDNLARVVNLTQVKYNAGTGSELDVARIKSLFAENQAKLPALRASIKRAARHLDVLTGQLPGAMANLLQPTPLPAVNTELKLGNVGELILRRPDLQRTERQLAAATANIGFAEAELYPRVELNGFFGFFSASGADLLHADSRAWSLTPTLSWQVFDLASIHNRITAAAADSEGVLANYQGQLLTALEQTQDAFVTYSEDQNRLLLLLEQQRNSSRAQALAQAQYREGAIELLDVLDTERTKLAAEDAVILAENSVYQGIVEIYHNLGGGWDSSSSQLIEKGKKQAANLIDPA
jgi:outer membrane protein, multidrug efflux system